MVSIGLTSEAPKPGIVYAATRKHTEELATALTERGVNALAYHAGIAATERTRIQEASMSDASDVIVATTAFGMGVDKPNVRFVYHLEVSDWVDACHQEIGRAGRDGEPTEAVFSSFAPRISVFAASSPPAARSTPSRWSRWRRRSRRQTGR